MNIAQLFIDGAARFGLDRKAAHYDGCDYTARELHDRAAHLAGALAAAGVGPDDRVALMVANSPDVPVVYDAVARLGAATIPMLFVLAPPEIAHICASAEPLVLLTQPGLDAGVRAAVAGLAAPPEVWVLGEEATEARIAAAEPRTDVVDRAADDMAVLVFTSGTTGAPKGVVLTHGNLLAQVDMSSAIFTASPEDIALGVLPMAHLFGLAGVLSAQRYGYSSVILPWFAPDAFLQMVEEHRVTQSALVPTMLSMVLNHPDFERRDLSSLREVVVGASPLPVELAEEWERRTGSQIVQGYGMTETSAGAVLERPDEPHRPGSCGRAYDGMEVVVMAEGRILPPGEAGEICFRGPNVTPGYWRNPEATAAAIVDGFLHSGDIGHIDADGYVYVTDRVKDLIIRAGLNIYPRDVEEVLYAHPAVAEAGVVGVPDAQMGEKVVACVVRRPGADVTPDELRTWSFDRLAKYKTPAEYVFMDALPKSTVGKILKRELRDQLSGG